MANSTEKVLSLKDFDTNSMHVVNRARKRQIVMEKNLKASLLIIAAKKLKKEKLDADLLASNQHLRNVVDADNLPLEAYVNIFDERIKVLGGKVASLKELKEAQGDWLKEGQENVLKMLEPEFVLLKAEKDAFIAKYEANANRDKELDAERKEAAIADAKVELDAVKKKTEAALKAEKAAKAKEDAKLAKEAKAKANKK